ncbi:MAG: sulfur carrier protein ThiS [Zoogloeaceae bacterium]|jgi:sulfur carrier protein|nr:sulfur carrier protein ThiS [Zoogloeaceae bacterium]
MPELTLNGERRSFPDTLATLSDLMAHLGYADKRVAVEKNGGIVPRSRYAATPLSSGDALEIVVAVGGG